MKKRIEKKVWKRKFKKYIKSLGIKPKDLYINGTGAYFFLQKTPDLMWGIWDIPEEGYVIFGQLKMFVDKFKPSAVDYVFRDPSEFLSFVQSYSLPELLRKGNIDYDFMASSKIDPSLSDEEILAHYWKNYAIQKFENEHFGMNQEEWKEALKEKRDFELWVSSKLYVGKVEWCPQSRNKGYTIHDVAGEFKVILNSGYTQEEADEIEGRMHMLRHCCIGRPKIYEYVKS